LPRWYGFLVFHGVWVFGFLKGGILFFSIVIYKIKIFLDTGEKGL
jgi:hypothetical protein